MLYQFCFEGLLFFYLQIDMVNFYFKYSMHEIFPPLAIELMKFHIDFANKNVKALLK